MSTVDVWDNEAVNAALRKQGVPDLHDDMDVVEFRIPADAEAVAIYDSETVHILTVAKLRALLEEDAR